MMSAQQRKFCILYFPTAAHEFQIYRTSMSDETLINNRFLYIFKSANRIDASATYTDQRTFLEVKRTNSRVVSIFWYLSLGAR